jgi:hypothetical protein
MFKILSSVDRDFHYFVDFLALLLWTEVVIVDIPTFPVPNCRGNLRYFRIEYVLAVFWSDLAFVVLGNIFFF